MRLIPSRYLENWHSEVDKLTHGHLPLTPSCVPNVNHFQFDQVQQYTTSYIINKKERAIPGLCDERLIKLIQKSDSKPVALAACTHLLSPQAVRTLIVQDFIRLEPTLYLQLIILAHHGAPSAVEELDAKRAKTLLFDYQNLRILADGQWLESLFEVIKTGVPKNSLVYSTIYTYVTLAIPNLVANLLTFRVKHQWHRIWTMISWLSTISLNEAHIKADCLDPIELLDRNFRNWRMWAVWRPKASISRENCCDENRRALLHQFLALEGPDEQVDPMSSLYERLLAQEFTIKADLATVGSLKFCVRVGTQDEARELLRRLYECIGHASHHSLATADLFAQLFCGVSISKTCLDIMDAVVAVADFRVTNQVLLLHKAQRYRPSEMFDAAKSLLPLLRDPKCVKLRASATGKLAADTVMEMIRDCQAKLKIGWEEEKISQTWTTTAQLEREFLLTVRDLSESMAELQLSVLANESFLELVNHWPTHKELFDLQKLRVDIAKMEGAPAIKLLGKTTLYLHSLFIARDSINQDTRDMIQTVSSFWTASTTTPERQELAILLAFGPGRFRLPCIAKMDLLSNSRVLEITRRLIEWTQTATRDLSCWKVTRFLAEINDTNADEILATWKPVLYRMLKARGQELVTNALGWKPRKYVSFFTNLDKVFGDNVWNPKLSPPILDPSLRTWAARLTTQIPALLRLESKKDCHPALRIILKGANPWILEGILCHLGQEGYWIDNPSMCEASCLIVSLLSEENAQDVYDVLCSVFQMTNGGAAHCVRLLDHCYDGQGKAAPLLVAAWQQDPSWSDYDQMGFRDLARLLEIYHVNETNVTMAAVEAMADYVDIQYAKLLEEAQRLDAMRVGLKMRDYEGVSQLLYDNMIEDTTWMEDSFATLPIELLNVVERIDESEVEIIFPLTDITPLQRAAMGIGNAQSLLIRLFIGDYGSHPKFCIHLDNEPKLDSHIHSQWTVFKSGKAPELPICHGTVTTATYQLARLLSRFLVEGFTDLSSIHSLVSKSLKSMGSECLICGMHHGAVLRRATICDAWECAHIFSQSPIEIRLADIRHDPLAVDMILTMIYSAINSGFHNLLKDCPFDQKTCLMILRELPSMETIQRSKYLWATIKDWHDGKSEQFLTWAICSFRGFLSTATGNLRIPSLPPGTLQFVLANAAPTKELAFATEFATNTQQSRVMFHGTSLDRLYLIMHQGLKVMSGTALQAYGSAYGNGIYLAEDPGTSWAYAKAATTKTNWRNSAIKMNRVLLGCEMTAPASVAFGGGIHVVPTEAAVMVRYVFVVPTETVTMPIAGHVGPAMMSVYNSLRSRAL